MVILSKACKPDNFKSHNFLKFNFMNIRGLRSNFVDASLSFNQTLLTFLLSVRQTWMTQLILGNLVLICMVSQFMLKKDFLLHGTYL